MPSGAQIEERWINLWNEMYEVLQREPQLRIVDEDWQPVSLDDYQGLVQNAVYEGLRPRLERTWLQGTQVLRAFGVRAPKP